MKLYNKIILVAAALSAAAPQVSARDGKAWGGQCIVTKGSSVYSRSCSADSVTCSGNGWGGVSCSIDGVAGTYSAKPALEKMTPGMKQKLSAQPAVSQ